MKEPETFETKLRSYLVERIRRASTPVGADRLMERVMRGAHRRQRLAPLASGAIALAVVLLVGAPTTLILLHRGSHVSAPPTAKKPPLPTVATTPPSPSPSAAPAARLVVSDVTFADADHGWAVGASCGLQMCNVLVDSSTDGGVTWSSAVVLGQNSEIPPSSVGGLSVWAEGGNVWVGAGPEGIYESHDAGNTWVHSFTSPEFAVASGPTAAWALAGCDPSGNACVLDSSKVGSDVWTAAPNQPPFSAGSNAQTHPFPIGIAVARNGAVFLYESAPALSFTPQVLVSADGGRSWAHHPLPCTIGVASLQSSDGKTLWVLCGGGGGAGSGPKAVYVSNDSGVTWQDRANNLATPPVGNISFGGYASSLALTEQDVALVGAHRGGVQRSTDGGRTWTDVGSHTSCLLDGNGISSLWFLPSGDGWAVEENSNGGPTCPLLVRTTDAGITWEAAGAPLGWTAN